jgi:hypothetical protein
MALFAAGVHSNRARKAGRRRALEANPRDPARICCGKTTELEELLGNRFGERRTCAMGGVAGFLS